MANIDTAFEIVPQSKTEQDKIESVLIFVKVSATSILLKN